MGPSQKIFGKYKNELAEKDRVGGTVDRLKGVNERLADIVEATENLDILAAVKASSPWAEALGGALGDVLPPVRFALKFLEELNKVDDPAELGYLAATLAFQQAVEQAWQAMPPDTLEKVEGADPKQRKKALSDLREIVPPESYDFKKFSFESGTRSAFFADAERYLKMSADGLGLTGKEFLDLRMGVRMRFVANLKSILSHGSTREKFAPFRDLMTLETREARAYDALLEHADYQRWLFEEQPVLGREPFTLAQVYTDVDCGLLKWEEVHQPRDRGAGEKPVDPFNEVYGGRRPLVDTVLDLIADKNFRDAIVIQGVAGSGKSTSTLRLAVELRRRGLQPIRIELKHLDARESAPIE